MEDALLTGAGGGLPLPYSMKVRIQGGVDTVFFCLARIAIIVVNIGPTVGFDTVGKTGTEIQFQKHFH